MAGPVSIATTFDEYGHLFDALQEVTADRLDELARKASQKVG